ncbi:MAG: iron-sulfur cluster assembly scaffold protein [Desulfobacteraceae bacterium]|jgi:nitrogen fixation NifU-like protein
MYNEKVMEHFTHPRNAGTMEDADGIGEVGNPVCGDMMTFYIKVQDDRLVDVKFQTFGCVAAIAVSSMVSEMAIGKGLIEAKAISKKAVAESLDGLPKEKMHCSNLGAQALALAIADFEEKTYGKPESGEKDSLTEKIESAAICPHCKAMNPVSANFCMGCGEKIER